MKAIVGFGLATWLVLAAARVQPERTISSSATRSRRSWNGGAFTATAKRRPREISR